MLTKSEREWLEKRKNRFAPCGGQLVCCHGCLIRLNCPLHPDYQDAAEFEARCKAKMAIKPIMSKPCAYDKCPRDFKTCPFFEMDGGKSMPFCRQLCVHIAVEQEMDNVSSHHAC